MAYEVHLDVYDGPFELLLQLITGRELDVYAISLAEIVDGFLAEIKRLEAIDLELATEFLLIAATLVELKCRGLLPSARSLELDDELSLFEARDYLLARLVECRTFSGAGRALCVLEEEAGVSRARRYGPDERFLGLVPDVGIGVEKDELARIALVALGRAREPVALTASVHVDRVTVADALSRLCVWLPELGAASFVELADRFPGTSGFVACFLAVLELYKRGALELDQASTFAKLQVTWLGGDELMDEAPDSYSARHAP